jgi:hypothetical protein
MAVGLTPSLPPISTEGSAAIGGGAASVDVWLLWSFVLGMQVARQGMVVTDPSNPLGAAAVTQNLASGAEFGIVVKPAANAQDATNLLQAVHNLTIEMQNLIILFGGTPMTPSPFLGNTATGLQ